MKNSLLVLGTFVGLLSFMGCAVKGHHRGSVAMKINDKVAHVGMGANEISVGDRVGVFREECEKMTAVNDASTCKKKELGRGVVKQILGKDYSLVEFDSGTLFIEGDIVQRLGKK